MPTWPASLPQNVLQSGFNFQLPNTSIATDMDTGPKKVRRRNTAQVTVYAVELLLNAAELAIFLTFFNEDTQSGSLRFDWVDPVTQDAAEFRFSVSDGAPSVSAKEGFFQVSFNMEKLP
jgi:hypothetical protein